MPKKTTVAMYAGVFTLVISFVAIGYRPPQSQGQVAQALPAVAPQQTDDTKAALDQAAATQIATTMAQTTHMAVAANVANLSISLNAKAQLSQTDDALINKPQIVQPTASNRSLVEYTAKEGDTVQTIASAHHVSTQTIQWANNLSSEDVEVGKQLVVPPLDGVVYTVKANDTAESLAQKYSADAKRIISFNDLELTGIKEGQKIVLPGATLPEEERPGYVAPQSILAQQAVATPNRIASTPASNGYSIVDTSLAGASAGNAYAFGNCTWWAYERRMQLGHPVGSFWGNATTWDIYAQAAGYAVNHQPTVGAVFQMKAFVDAYTGGYGHVGIVESVNGDGSVNVSEMNYAGNFNRVTYRTIPASQAAIYNYIH
jgi:surface antigen